MFSIIMTKYYCKYCSFRTIRNYRLKEHYINMHKKKNRKKRVDKINERGFWEGEVEHCFDEPLCKNIIKFFSDKKDDTIMDLGCGCHGHYTLQLIKNGLKCKGFDGNPETPKLTNNVCQVRDLTEDFDDLSDWIICLEVAEHIPKKYEKILIKNLHKNNKKGIILSWAIVGQKGAGHVNCQNNDYVKNIFNNLGYKNDIKTEEALRVGAKYSWFKKGVMVFRK